MLSGSMALVHYAQPRTTVDIDIVLDLRISHVTGFLREFGRDYYIPEGRVADAIHRNGMFNILDNRTIIKVDCVVKKRDAFSDEAFRRRAKVHYARSLSVWIISKEDLVLSKLNWARESRSERQMMDVANIIRNGFDESYVELWTRRLGVTELLEDCRKLLQD